MENFYKTSGHSDIQAVLFEKKYWTTQDARDWLNQHNLKPIKRVHITDEYLRYRINPPVNYDHYRTIHNYNEDIAFVIGFY